MLLGFEADGVREAKRRSITIWCKNAAQRLDLKNAASGHIHWSSYCIFPFPAKAYLAAFRFDSAVGVERFKKKKNKEKAKRVFFPGANTGRATCIFYRVLFY